MNGNISKLLAVNFWIENMHMATLKDINILIMQSIKVKKNIERIKQEFCLYICNNLRDTIFKWIVATKCYRTKTIIRVVKVVT